MAYPRKIFVTLSCLIQPDLLMASLPGFVTKYIQKSQNSLLDITGYCMTNFYYSCVEKDALSTESV